MSQKLERFQKYLNMYESMVLKNVSHYVGYDTAQDLSQETFLKMYLYIDYLDDWKVKPWLLVVSQNIALNYMKQLEPTEKMPEESELTKEVYGGSLEESTVNKEAAHELLRTAFQLLYAKNPIWYEIMLDFYILEMSSKEIAEILNMSAANVDVTKLRARKYLSKILGERYHELF